MNKKLLSNYLEYVYELLLRRGEVKRHSSSLLDADVLGGAILAVQKLPEHHEKLSARSSLLQSLHQTRRRQVRLLDSAQKLNNLNNKRIFKQLYSSFQNNNLNIFTCNKVIEENTGMY